MKKAINVIGRSVMAAALLSFGVGASAQYYGGGYGAVGYGAPQVIPGTYSYGNYAPTRIFPTTVRPMTDAPGSLRAGIWVDPDGCQHWVMDMGLEGFMDPVLTSDGRPICGHSCGALRSEVLFDSGQAQLRPGSERVMSAAAGQLRRLGKRSITVVGHTDSDGSAASNVTLSQRRANAVAQALGSMGVNISGATGVGESYPIASNGTAAGKAQNRRVELVCR